MAGFFEGRLVDASAVSAAKWVGHSRSLPPEQYVSNTGSVALVANVIARHSTKSNLCSISSVSPMVDEAQTSSPALGTVGFPMQTYLPSLKPV